MRFCFIMKYIGPWSIIDNIGPFFSMLNINILSFHTNKIKYIIHDIGPLIPNSKFLGRLKLKKQYFD